MNRIAYPYRPQRYHAWDVAETWPRVLLPESQTHPILNFSEAGLCFGSSEELSNAQAGDLLPALQVFFGDQLLLNGPGKIKHVSLQNEQWCYGVRFLEDRLNLPQVFALRDALQTHSSLIERLRQKQRSSRYGPEFLAQFEIEAFYLWEGKRRIIEIKNVSEFGFCFLDKGLFSGPCPRPGDIL